MPTPPDFAARSNVMVDGQLRPTKITHPGVLAAMRQIPRELFVPADLQEQAYTDTDIELCPGRYLLRPLSIARLAQLADPAKGERALVIGGTSGYLAAVLAACGAKVTLREQDPILLAIARGRAEYLPGVTLSETLLSETADAEGGYDIVIIEGAVRAIPADFAKLLTTAGRLIAIISPHDGSSFATIGRLQENAIVNLPTFDIFAPLVQPLQPQKGFSL